MAVVKGVLQIHIMKKSTYKVALSAILLAIVIILQLIKNVSAFISGPAINTVLVIATLELGLGFGIGFSIIVPIMSILFSPASPMTMIATQTFGISIPIIIIGNVLFILLAWLGGEKDLKQFIIFLIIGAVLKWLFMWGAGDLILLRMFAEKLGKLAAVITKVFSTLQLYSGLLSIILICPIRAALEKNKM